MTTLVALTHGSRALWWLHGFAVGRIFFRALPHMPHAVPPDPQLVYLQAVIDETLRLMPPAPYTVRVAEKNMQVRACCPHVGAAVHVENSNARNDPLSTQRNTMDQLPGVISQASACGRVLPQVQRPSRVSLNCIAFLLHTAATGRVRVLQCSDITMKRATPCLFSLKLFVIRDVCSPAQVLGYDVPAGTMLYIAMHQFHKNSSIWQDAEVGR